MNNITKITLIILCCVIMLLCGFFICKYQVYTKSMDLYSQTLQVDNNSNLLESDLANSTQEQLDVKTDTPSQKIEDDVLTLSKAKLAFLKEHLFGQWRFSERVFALDDSKSILYDTTSNISKEGQEELKKSVVLCYQDDYVDFPVRIGQNSFTNARDMFLFGAYGGFQWVRNPIYRIEKLDTNNINLEDFYDLDGHDVQLTGTQNFIKVTYQTEIGNEEDTERKGGRIFANVIYINPNNKDTIYVDFCGLWRMERDKNNYNTGGKSDR